MICKQFNKLPGDPALLKLNDVQKLWILTNMEEDVVQLSGKSTSPNVSSSGSSYGLDDEEFLAYTKQLRAQNAERKKKRQADLEKQKEQKNA